MRCGEIFTVAGGKDYVGKPRPVVIVPDDSFDGTESITICAFTTDPTDAPLFRLAVEPDAQSARGAEPPDGRQDHDRAENQHRHPNRSARQRDCVMLVCLGSRHPDRSEKRERVKGRDPRRQGDRALLVRKSPNSLPKNRREGPESEIL